MEALSDILHLSRLTGAVYLHAQFRAPWCLTAQVPPEFCAPLLGASSHFIPYHYVMEGEVRFRGSGAQDILLGQGDIILLPHNQQHLLGSDLSLTPVMVREVAKPSEDGSVFSVRHGGQGEVARMVCGFLGYDGRSNDPLVRLLPSALKLNFDHSDRGEWIRSTFQYAAAEVDAGRPGARTLLTKLSELLFSEAIRHYAESLPKEQGGWLAGLRDPYIAKSLAMFHGDLSRAWTVDDLAREVGLSRSAVAERFVRSIGVAPMRYLSNRRMQVAAQQLSDSRASLAQIADAVGYESEAAFSRAFKNAFGQAPATWRRMSVTAAD